MPEVGNLEWLETTIKNADNGPVKRSGHSVTIIGLPNNPSLIVIGGLLHWATEQRGEAGAKTLMRAWPWLPCVQLGYSSHSVIGKLERGL
jgi:hypothetical protein